MTKTVHFGIDCEWLCNFIRDRVYWEGLEYSKGVELLKNSFDLSDELCDDILRGKKVIRGINEGELVDDDKYSVYQEYLKREERKRIRLAIHNDMLINPLNYVDPFATKYSYWGFEKVQAPKHNNGVEACVTIQDVLEFFEYHKDYLTLSVNDLSNRYLRGGCYGLENMDYFFDNHIIDGPVTSKIEFWDSLYVFFEKLLAEDNWLPKEHRNEIIMRQESHRAWRRAQQRRSPLSIDERVEEVLAQHEKEQLEGTKIETDYIDGSEHLSGIKYVPSEKFTEYGIISPDGDFYACDFAAHKIAAYMIAVQKGYMKAEEDADSVNDDLDNYGTAKELLFNKGYTFVNTIGHAGLMNKWYMDYEQMPQKAIDKCFDWSHWNKES